MYVCQYLEFWASICLFCLIWLCLSLMWSCGSPCLSSMSSQADQTASVIKPANCSQRQNADGTAHTHVFIAGLCSIEVVKNFLSMPFYMFKWSFKMRNKRIRQNISEYLALCKFNLHLLKIPLSLFKSCIDMHNILCLHGGLNGIKLLHLFLENEKVQRVLPVVV